MLIQKKLIKDMDKAAYNPRVDLRPGDDEYEALKDSLTEFGLVIPIIWNQRTNRVVGGHQRLTVEEDLGHTEVYVSVVNLDEMQEKQLNIALNKAQGAWDDGKLAELMNSLGNRAQDTGFKLPEIEALTRGCAGRRLPRRRAGRDRRDLQRHVGVPGRNEGRNPRLHQGTRQRRAGRTHD